MTNEFEIASDRVVEPLADSALLQWQIAERHCIEDCRWYHGPRLFLRRLGVIRGIQPDSLFMLDAIGELARRTARARVLVSGAADYGMLAHVVTAFRRAGRPLRVTVVDTCLTPLRMNAWYGERTGVPVDVHHGDIFDLDAERSFDLICTHAFFGRFNAEGRRRLAKKWWAMLAPGGAVVTAHRLRHATADREKPFSERQKLRIRERARLAVRQDGEFAGVAPAMVAAWTAEFLRRKVTYPVCSTAEIESFLGAAGFDVSISCHRDRTAAPGPALDDRAWRVGVVATKRV